MQLRNLIPSFKDMILTPLYILETQINFTANTYDLVVKT